MLLNQHFSKLYSFTIISQNLIIDGYGNFLYYKVMKNLSNNDEEIDREKYVHNMRGASKNEIYRYRS